PTRRASDLTRSRARTTTRGSSVRSWAIPASERPRWSEALNHDEGPRLLGTSSFEAGLELAPRRNLAGRGPAHIDERLPQPHGLGRRDQVTSASKADEFPRSEEHTSELQSRFDLVC